MRFINQKALRNLSEDDKDILDSEYITFSSRIESLPKDSYYVYALYGMGEVFYIGKGKGHRAYSHLIEKGNSLKNKMIDYLYEQDYPPVVFIIRDNLSEEDAFTIEKEYIEKYGRLIDGSGQLTNIHNGYIPTKELDKEKARAGGLILNLTGTRGGIFTKKWRDENPELVSQHASKAGKISWQKVKETRLEEHREWSARGGEITGSKLFWTNGKETVRSHECPGDGWKRGNGSFNKNSSSHSSLPKWTNGKINRNCEERPGDDYFNGVTRKISSDPTKKNVIVFTKQHKDNIIPSTLKTGQNIVDINEEY